MTKKQDNITDILNLKELRHKAEKPLHIISLLFSLITYGIFTYLAVEAARNDEAGDILTRLFEDEEEGIFEPLFRYGALFVLIALAVTFLVILFRGIRNYGEAVTCDVPVSDRQFPELKNTCTAYAKRLGIRYVPELFISEENNAEIEFSSLTVKSGNYIRLNGYSVYCSHESDDYTLQYFRIASELAHIALGHRSILWILLTLPARVLPLYRHMYVRVMNYSADRVAAELMGKEEAVTSIVFSTNDFYFISIVDRKAFLKDVKNLNTGWHKVSRLYYNMTSDIPSLAERVSAILDPH